MGCGGGKAASDNKGKGEPNIGAKDDKKEMKSQNKQYAKNIEFLAKVPLFKRLPTDKKPVLAANMESKDFKQNDIIIKQGEEGNEFFVIKSGEASVVVDGTEVATLKAGDYFGEASVLREEPRAATITVTSETLQTLMMTRAKFQEMNLHEQLAWSNRKALGGGKVKDLAKPPSPKTPADKTLISNCLKSNEALTSVVTLDTARIDKLIEIAWKEDIDSGVEIVKEGDPDADFFYIVASGKFTITSLPPDEGNNEHAAPQLLSTVTEGGSFGELALLYLTPRAATVTAAEASTVWVFDRTNFKKILMQVSDAKVNEYMKRLERVETFSSMIEDHRRKVAQALVEMHFSKDEIILQQGEQGSTFYLLYEGEVAIIKDDKQVSSLTVNKNSAEAQYFGEKALIDNETRAATVKVVSEIAKALALDRNTFDVVLRPLTDVMSQKQAQPQQSKKKSVTRKDLTRIGLLGCGGFGAVELWEHKTTKETYAMKALSKGYIVKTGMQESVMNEKNILLMTNSPFIIKLYETYNGAQSLYFLLEAALGGELYATYNRKGLHGSEKHAKFYLAGTVFAFEHCHERHIIYRDLKPENLLLTDKGRLKLTDMGLAKFVIGKTFTTCGTPDYFAPEIIASTGHTNAVDWWMLGILLFELLSGRPPFESAYPMQTYSKVMKGIGKVNFPQKCTGTQEQLIKGLLKREPSERLPMRTGGTQNIKDQKWYAGFDWNAMFAQTLDPPFLPTVKSAKDIANFSARKEDMPKQVEYREDGSGWDKNFATQ